MSPLGSGTLGAGTVGSSSSDDAGGSPGTGTSIELAAAPGGVTVHFTVCRGTAPILRFTMASNGSIVGQTAWFTVRRHERAPDPATFEVEADIEVDGSESTAGVWTVELSRADSLTFQLRDYVYSLERTDDGAEDLYASGVMVVDSDVRNAS